MHITSTNSVKVGMIFSKTYIIQSRLPTTGGGETKNNKKYFSITCRLIKIEKKILAPKLQIISSFFWPKNFGWSAEISASNQKNNLRYFNKRTEILFCYFLFLPTVRFMYKACCFLSLVFLEILKISVFQTFTLTPFFWTILAKTFFFKKVICFYFIPYKYHLPRENIKLSGQSKMSDFCDA